MKRSCKCGLRWKICISFMGMCCNSNLFSFHYSYQIIDPHDEGGGGGQYSLVSRCINNSFRHTLSSFNKIEALSNTIVLMYLLTSNVHDNIK